MSRNNSDNLSDKELQQEAFDRLKKFGVATAVVHYSGGNDDGGAEGISTVMADGTSGEIKQHYLEWQHVPGKGMVQPNGYPEEVREEAELADLLVAPVYRRWGSFAGEFYVSGEVIWDVTKHKVTFSDDYAETHHTYEEMEW
jgi:hypothetical protein